MDEQTVIRPERATAATNEAIPTGCICPQDGSTCWTCGGVPCAGSPAPETPVAELIASACEAIRRLGTLRRDMGTVMGLIERRSRPSQDHLDQLQMLKKWRRDIDHVEAALTQAHPLPSQTQEVEKEAARLLRELYTLVKGECPSLLNEDSGGDARLALAIEAALLAAPARQQQENEGDQSRVDGHKNAQTLYRSIGMVRSLIEWKSELTADERAQVRMLQKWEDLAIEIGWPDAAAPARQPTEEKYLSRVDGELRAASPTGSTASDVAPIPLTKATIEAVRDWAADDRLWSTKDTTEFNLCAFARLVLKHSHDASGVNRT